MTDLHASVAAAAASGRSDGAGTRSKRSMCSSELESRVEAMRIQLEEERRRRLEVESQIQHLVLAKGGPQAAAVAKLITESELAAQQQRAGSGAAAAASGGSRDGSERSQGSSRQSRASRQSDVVSASGAAGAAGSGVRASTPYGSSSSKQQRPPRNLPPLEHTPNSIAARAAVPAPPSRSVLPAAANRVSVASTGDSNSGGASNNIDIVAKCEAEAAQCERLLRQLNHCHATVLSRKPGLPAAARGITRKPGAAGCDYVMARRSKATPAQLYMMNQWHQERVDKINAFTYGVASH